MNAPQHTHLEAGGIPDAARSVREQAERMNAELHRQSSEHKKGDAGAGKGGGPDMAAVLHQMHKQMDEMRKQMEEMRRQMQELARERR